MCNPVRVQAILNGDKDIAKDVADKILGQPINRLVDSLVDFSEKKSPRVVSEGMDK